MHRNGWLAVLAVVLVAFVVGGATFTDLNNPQHWGNDGQVLTPDLDANFALLEAGTVTQNQITLQNGEIIGNVTDATVSVNFDDDAVTLGQLVLWSKNAAASIANNDLASLVFRSYDSATQWTEWASVDFLIADKTDSSEDGQAIVKAYVAGTERTLATFAAATTIGAAQSTLALTSSDWAIDATGVGTGLGNLTSDGTVTCAEVKPDGKYGVVGPDATTGLMVQYGSCTNGTNAFAVSFGGAAKVFIAAQATNAAAVASGVTSSGFTATLLAGGTLDYFAIGPRP